MYASSVTKLYASEWTTRITAAAPSTHQAVRAVRSGSAMPALGRSGGDHAQKIPRRPASRPAAHRRSSGGRPRLLALQVRDALLDQRDIARRGRGGDVGLECVERLGLLAELGVREAEAAIAADVAGIEV